MRAFALLLLIATLHVAAAQGGGEDGAGAYERGLAHRTAGELDAAARAFREAVEAEPTVAGPEGSGWGLLGRVLRDAGRPSEALQAWDTGHAVLAADGLVDLDLEAGLLHLGAASEDPARGASAADAYLTLLANGAAARLGPHLRALVLVVGAEERAVLGLDGDAVDGAAIAAWWRQRDPLPATAANERLVEHLGRTAVALDRYADGGGWMDGRGEVYVRLGPPELDGRIRLDAGEVARYLPDLVTAFRPSDVPDNEVWAYPSLHQGATFVFVSGPAGDYAVSSPEALVPAVLRRSTGGGERGQRRGAALLFALEAVYGQLAHFDTRYHTLRSEVAEYTQALDQVFREQAFAIARATASDRGTASAASDAAFQAADGAIAAPRQSPTVFAQMALGRAAALAMEREGERLREVPQARSTVLSGVRQVPTAFRVSRFLAPSGATRVDLDWAIEPTPRTDSLLVSWVAVVQDTAFVEVARTDVALLVAPSRSDAAFPVQTGTLTLSAPGRRVAAQWELRSFTQGEGSIRPGALVEVNAVGSAPLVPLADAGFEVSDLRPIESVDARPYPYTRAAPGLPLSLYFEIYGLDGARGQFTVEYTVTRRRRGSLLRREQADVEDGRLASRAVGGRSAQYLILETSSWEGADEVEVEVVVTSRDGQRRVRAVRFDVVG